MSLDPSAGDLRDTVKILDRLAKITDNGHGDLYVSKARVEISNGAGYDIGALVYEDEEWRLEVAE